MRPISLPWASLKWTTPWPTEALFMNQEIQVTSTYIQVRITSSEGMLGRRNYLKRTQTTSELYLRNSYHKYLSSMPHGKYCGVVAMAQPRGHVWILIYSVPRVLVFTMHFRGKLSGAWRRTIWGWRWWCNEPPPPQQETTKVVNLWQSSKSKNQIMHTAPAPSNPVLAAEGRN